MQYYSLNNASPAVGFKEATIKGQAPDKGLYFPESIPSLAQDLIKNIGHLSHAEIAFSVIQPYVGDAIPEAELEKIVSLLPIDTTFTGRTDIWTFAIQALQLRLPTGYGFAAFWGSSSIQNLPQGMEWAEYASHSHNGYLDTALAMGLPGLMLLIAVLVIAPLRNFHSAD